MRYKSHPFFEDSVVPAKKGRCFPNNKSWITKDIKTLLNRKRRAHIAMDREELRAVQKEKLGEATNCSRERIEDRRRQKDAKEVGNGVKE